MTQLSLKLVLIPHEVENTLINQRAIDGYVNATAMCQAVGKKINHYLENRTTKDFIEELSSDTGIPAPELIQIVSGGSGLQGTWVHPDVAIHLGVWCSPKFAVQVSRWVREWATGTFRPSKLPYHIQRYIANRSEIPPTHFSMLNEMIFALIAPLESAGYTIPDDMVPDISSGRMFCKWLRDEKGIDTDTLPTYCHRFDDGRTVRPKLYPNEFLADFRKHFHEVWLPTKAGKYFKERDPKSLPFVMKILPMPVE
jgi:KilA-N domain